MSLEQTVRLFRERDHFLLTTHQNPDGDGLGAQCALYLALRKIGKRVVVANHDPLPRSYTWLPYAKDVQVTDEVPPHEVCVVLDAGDFTRIRDGVRREDYRTVVNIDHHFSNKRFGDLNWIDPAAAATGEMVYRLIRALGVVPDQDIAESVYTSLVTDTGAFKYSNTTPQVLRLAAELMENGADAPAVCGRIFGTIPRNALELTRLSLATLHTRESGRIGIMYVRQSDFTASGALDEDSDNLVDTVRKVQGVEVGVFLKERPDGRIKLSLRSRNGVDVSAIAGVFGGGGHKHAAGAVLDGPLEAAEEHVATEIAKAFKQNL